MIRLPKFDVLSPSSLEEALENLAAAPDETLIMAGGTDLIVGLKHELRRPDKVIWLGKIDTLRHIKFSPENGLRIGAMCALAELERHGDVRGCYQSLVEAARSIASPQIRNSGTVGGNLCLNTRCIYYDQSEFWRRSAGFCLRHGNGICHAAPQLKRCNAVFCSDLAPILIALGAEIEVVSAFSRRKMPLSELYSGDGAHPLRLKPTEILSQIYIPYAPGTVSRHSKFRHREALDFPLVNMGAALSFSQEKICTHAMLVLGAVSSSPIVIKDATEILVGAEVTADLLEKVVACVTESLQLLPNVNGSVSYRQKAVGHCVRLILTELLAQVQISRRFP